MLSCQVGCMQIEIAAHSYCYFVSPSLPDHLYISHTTYVARIVYRVRSDHSFKLWSYLQLALK